MRSPLPDKGKPAVRRGRKAMGQAQSCDCQVTEGRETGAGPREVRDSAILEESLDAFPFCVATPSPSIRVAMPLAWSQSAACTRQSWCPEHDVVGFCGARPG